MTITRRDFGKHAFTALATAAFAPAVLFTSACGQSVIAALVSTLGNAASSIATALGDTVLAETITTDTTAVVAGVNNWKAGTGTAAVVVELLNTLLAHLNLIPVSTLYATLVSLAISTAVSLITILSAGTPAAMKSNYATALKAGVPQDAAHFKAQWNGIVAGSPQLTTVRIK